MIEPALDRPGGPPARRRRRRLPRRHRLRALPHRPPRADVGALRGRRARPRPAGAVRHARWPTVPPSTDVDETALGDPRIGQPVPPAAVVPVEDPAPIVRARDAGHVTVVDGSGDGVVDAAAAGLLDDPGTGRRRPPSPATPPPCGPPSPPARRSIVTDTNRKRAEQWRGLAGHDRLHRGRRPAACWSPIRPTTACPSSPAPAPTPRRWPSSAGGARAVASAYGEPNAYRPEDRADQAIDGDPATAWRVGDRGEVHGPAASARAARPPARSTA